MHSPITFGMFLRINIKNPSVAIACARLLENGGQARIRPAPQPAYAPQTNFGAADVLNSGSAIFAGNSLMFSHENPSKNRVLQVFGLQQEPADKVFQAFNRINANEQPCAEPVEKPNFASLIREKFVPVVHEQGVGSFALLVDTKNPQVILYSDNPVERPFSWFVVHDDYTHFLVATQEDLKTAEERFASIPGTFLFDMAVGGGTTSFHLTFLTQKFRRLEKSCDRSVGKFRALSGVEEYLARLSNNSEICSVQQPRTHHD